MNTFAKPVVVWCLFCACTPSLALAGPSPDALARSILGKAGIHVGVCELPRVGDGILAAALARTGIAQVHGLAAEARAVETARRPAAESKLLGSQVVIEAGSPAAIPLRDWVADLVVVADATDENLPAVPAAEVARVLSPYRGTAVVGNPAGGKGGLSKAALSQWVKATGGTAAIAEDEGGLWAVVKMPPLAGGDDWGHFYHGPDGNPVSSDTVFRAGTCSLQCYDKPNVVDKWGTVVASAGRYFRVPGSFEHTSPYADALVVRSVYNGQILWQRPLEKQFGRNDSLLVATPQRVYLKHNNGVLILDPETGRELRRIVAADERHAVRWLLLCDGVLVTLTGDPQRRGPRA